MPNNTNDVYIFGNQESLGNWQPNKVKMNQISAYEMEISLNLTYPSEFKFTHENRESEAIITKLSREPNFILNEKPQQSLFYSILRLDRPNQLVFYF